MDGDATWRATHRDFSEIDLKFREMAKESPDFLDRSRFAVLEPDGDFLRFRLQPWLTFLGRAKLEELKRVSLGVHRLLCGLRERIFRNDWAKVADFYHLGSPVIAEIVCSSPTGAETAISRGDFIDTASGFKCIEFNCSPNLGGWDINVILGMHLSVPATAQFIANEGIQVASTDPVLEMFRHVFADLQKKGLATDGQVTIGFVADPGGELPDTHPRVLHLQREMKRAIETFGLDISGRIVSCSYRTVEPRGEAAYFGGRRLDALIEYYHQSPPPIYGLFKRDRLALYNGPIGAILSTKSNLALLSQHAASGIYSAGERAFIEAHIPWSRLVVPGAVDYEAETRSLSDLLTVCQDRFVLKKAESYGGKDVLLGRATPAEVWRRAIDTALAAGGWIAQEVQESRPYLYQSGTYGCSLHDMIWGPFSMGDQYGGVMLRVQPKAGGGAVNLSLTATEGVMVEV